MQVVHYEKQRVDLSHLTNTHFCNGTCRQTGGSAQDQFEARPLFQLLSDDFVLPFSMQLELLSHKLGVDAVKSQAARFFEEQ